MASENLIYDVLIVGGGPAGLSAAIQLGKLCRAKQFPLKIALIEKGATIGAHILSGAVFEPRALNELLPEWQSRGAPIKQNVTKDAFWWLTENGHLSLPIPPQMKNHGNFIISLELLCEWLKTQAEELGIDIFPGYAGTDILYNASGVVQGIITNSVGLNKKGEKKSNFMSGVAIQARYTLLAEGARGSLTKILCEKFKLRRESSPQTYGLGIKELWEIDPAKHRPGHVLHSVGWPLDRNTYGGSFLYHMTPNLVSLGFVVGLDYQNTYLDPFLELQRFKQHPEIRPLLLGGRCLCYGARALNEGGFQSLPKLVFPGGLLIGCAAGFLNVPKLKGSHTAMKSGMIAAEVVFNAFKENKGPVLTEFETAIQHSWIWKELKLARNIRPGFRYGLFPGLAYAAIDTYLLRGHAPWTFRNHADHLCLKPAKYCKKIAYPKPDGIVSFDKLTALQLSNTNHNEDQPPHLLLRDPKVEIDINIDLYDAPEERYCPANVYEIIRDQEGKNPHLQINAANCLHCKTCDIKDPTQNIVWVPPEGGGGPNYTGM